jgi:trigger factor
MKTDLKKLPRSQVELTIELTVEEFQPFLKQAAQKISQTNNFAGFRPGKASFELIKKRVGEAEIWQQAIEPATKKTFLLALEQNNLITVGSPKIEIIKLAPDNPVIYKATISLLPQVKLGDLTKIKITRQPIQVSEEKIKTSLNNLQKMRAKEILVNRPAQNGDKLEINFAMFLDGIPIDQGKHQKFPLLLGQNSFIPGLEKELIGLMANQTKNFSLKFPANYYQKNLAAKLVDFKVKVLAVYQLELPKLDDELAKSLGNFKNLAEVTNLIRQNLQTEAQKQEENRLEEEMINQIINQSQFEDIPDILIDAEIKKMIAELEHNLEDQGLKLADYLTHLKKTKQDLMLDFAPPAVKRVKSALILRQVGQDQNIKVGEKEIETEVQNTLNNYAGNTEVEKNLQQPAYRDYLKNFLTAKKTIDYLKSVLIK